MSEAQPTPTPEINPKAIDDAFEEAECIELEAGDPRYAHFDVRRPDPEAFAKTLDFSAFERVGMSPQDIKTLKSFAFACAYFLSFPVRADRYGKFDQPDDHNGRSDWALKYKAKFGAAFDDRYIANRFRVSAMNPMLSRVKAMRELIDRYDVLPNKTGLQEAFGKIPKEYVDAPELFNARYTGSGQKTSENGTQLPSDPVLDELLRQLQLIEGVGGAEEAVVTVAPMTFNDKKKFVDDLSASARLFLAMFEKPAAA